MSDEIDAHWAGLPEHVQGALMRADEDEEQQEILNCCLCGYPIEHEMFPDGGYMGNNPAPFERHHAEWVDKTADRCCDWCNSLMVTPARLGLTGEAAVRMGRTFVRIHAVQQHEMKQRYAKEEIPEGASEK